MNPCHLRMLFFAIVMTVSPLGLMEGYSPLLLGKHKHGHTTPYKSKLDGAHTQDLVGVDLAGACTPQVQACT